jgi:hypothetical protein
MSIVLNGTTGITNDGGYTGDGVVFADTTPANTLVTDTSGNVMIGTTSASAKLSLNTGAAGNLAYFTDGVNTDFYIKTASSIATIGPNAGSTNLAFQTSGTERVRINSSGDFLVGTTSTVAGGGGHRAIIAFAGGVTQYGLGFRPAADNTVTATFSNAANGLVGSIYTTGSTTAYNTSSDYRLKESVQSMTGALAQVQQLKPCTYKWKADGSDGQGFIAHELAEVLPDAVTGEKDAVNEDGSIKPQGIDTSFLVATLTAAIQELKAELDTVKAELATLKGNQP